VKGEASLIGHRAFTHRPTGVTFMHYECELAAVIGRTAKHVKVSGAYDFIAGYTVANDYAIRDYLENWYRPNLSSVRLNAEQIQLISAERCFWIGKIEL